MNAHTPFDAKQDWTNPYCQNSSNDPMVDALLGNAYHVVRTVYCNLGNLKLIYDFLNQYGMVLGVQSEAELKALTTKAKYARIYGFSRAGDRQVTDYLYVEGDRTGIIPDDPEATGSWITVATSGSNSGGTSSGEGAYIPWVYSNGSATGGETTINVPDGTVGVPFIIINGDMQYVGRGFEFNVENLSVTLAQPLEEGDEVVFLLTGTPAVPDNPNVNDWIQINWLYNNGAAVGGEQVIAIPYTFQSIPAVYKNGLRLYKGLTTESYTADPDNQRILLTEPLATNDRLIVQIGGEARVLEASDHTLQEVARAANVKDSEVILSTDTTQVLNGKKVIFDVVAQHLYALPTLPSNVYINTVANGQLTYNPGSVTVNLVPIDDALTQDILSLVKSELATTTGAGLVNTTSGDSVQTVIDYLTVTDLAHLGNLATAKASTIKANSISIAYKYGNVSYLSTGTTGTPSTGNAHTFYDATGKGFTISEPKRQKNSDGIVAFSEVWTKLDLDPTLFEKAYNLGIGTFMFYTWTAGVDTYRAFLDLAELYGFDVILQAVPNGAYSSDLDADFAKLSPLFDHNAVVGLYLFDEPNLATYPLTRQGEIIAKVKTFSNLPLYAASNAEVNYESLPLHMDIDYVFTSQYAHFIDAVGIRRYAASMWSAMEEEGMRAGRIIPLLTAYWYENEAPTLNSAQITAVNNFICKNFAKIGAWAFYADKVGHFLENDDQIYNLVKQSLVTRKSKIKDCKLIRTLFRKANALPANCYKYQTKPVVAGDVFWLNPASTATWNDPAGVIRIKTGEQFAINFGRPVRLEAIIAAFTDNNGSSNSATLSLTFNPTIASGRVYDTTVTKVGGGDFEWFFTDLSEPPHLVTTVAIKVVSSTGSDYLILERIGFVVTE